MLFRCAKLSPLASGLRLSEALRTAANGPNQRAGKGASEVGRDARPSGGNRPLDIAIVGLGCRFPQARDPVSFWEMILEGRTAFRDIPPSRWNHAAFYDPSLRIPDKAYIARGAFL